MEKNLVIYIVWQHYSKACSPGIIEKCVKGLRKAKFSITEGFVDDVRGDRWARRQVDSIKLRTMQ